MGKYFNNWIKTRKAAFWVCCVVAILSIVGAVYYILTVNGLENDNGPLDLLVWGAVWCGIAGAVAFIILSLFNLANYGAAAMGILDLVAFCLILSPDVVAYVASNMMGVYANDILSLPGLIDIAVSAVIFLVCAILSNILAWIHLKKKDENTVQSSSKSGTGKDSGSNGTQQNRGLQQTPAKQQISSNPAGYNNPYGRGRV